MQCVAPRTTPDVDKRAAQKYKKNIPARAGLIMAEKKRKRAGGGMLAESQFVRTRMLRPVFEHVSLLRDSPLELTDQSQAQPGPSHRG